MFRTLSLFFSAFLFYNERLRPSELGKDWWLCKFKLTSMGFHQGSHASPLIGTWKLQRKVELWLMVVVCFFERFSINHWLWHTHIGWFLTIMFRFKCMLLRNSSEILSVIFKHPVRSWLWWRVTLLWKKPVYV